LGAAQRVPRGRPNLLATHLHPVRSVSNQVYFGDVTVDLSAVTTAQVAALWHLYENHNPRRGRMPLWCTKPHGGQMHLRKIRGQLWAAHYPGGGGTQSCTAQVRHESEGLPHRHMKDYAGRALEAAGYQVTEEFSTGKTRLDLAVDAPFKFGVEAQFSQIVERDAKSRTTKSFRAGWPALWLPGGQGVAQQLGYQLPVLRHNDNEIDWASKVPAKGTATATSVRRITVQHCTVSGPFDHCPDKRGGFCGKWHPWFNDMAPAQWFTLDDALTGIAAGALVLHQDRRGIVRIVPAGDLPRYRELTGCDGVFSPGRVSSPPKPQEQGRECAAERPQDELLIAAPATAVRRLRAPSDVAPLESGRCQKCGQVTHHPDSIASGLCRGCDLKMRAQERRLGITAVA
jgi:hypothetical protein